MAPHCIGSAWAHGKAPFPAAAAEMADGRTTFARAAVRSHNVAAGESNCGRG